MNPWRQERISIRLRLHFRCVGEHYCHFGEQLAIIHFVSGRDEQTARFRAALRRALALFQLDGLSINYDRRQVTVVGRPVKLTATE